MKGVVASILEALAKHLKAQDQRWDALKQELNAKLDAKLDALEQKLDAQDHKLDRVGRRFVFQSSKYGQVSFCVTRICGI